MATPAEELDVDGVKVRLTNPDKVYFPKLGSEPNGAALVMLSDCSASDHGRKFVGVMRRVLEYVVNRGGRGGGEMR
jgi:DNA primase